MKKSIEKLYQDVSEAIKIRNRASGVTTVNLEENIIQYSVKLEDLPSIDTTPLRVGVTVTINDQNPPYDLMWNGAAWVRKGVAGTQIQSDWAITDNTQIDYIKNKPNLYLSVASVSALPTSPENNSLCFVGGAVLKWYYYANLTAGWVTASDAGIALQDVWTAMSGAADAVTYESSDLITVTRDLAGIATPFKLTQTELFAALPNTGSLGPVDAQITSNGQLESAVASGKKCIFVAGNITLQSNINLIKNISILVGQNVNIDTNGQQILTNGFILNLSGFDQSTSKITPLNGPVCIYDNSQNFPLLLLNHICFDLSSVTTDDSGIGSASCIQGNNVTIYPGNASSCGVSILSNNSYNGYLNNSTIALNAASGSLTSAERVLYVNGGTTDNVYLQINGPPATNVIIDIESLSSIKNTIVQSNDGFVIHSAGKIINLDSVSGSALNTVCMGSPANAPFYLENVNIGDGDIDFNSLSNITLSNITFGSWSNFEGSNNKLNNLYFLPKLTPPVLTMGGSNNTINQLNSGNPTVGSLGADYATLNVTGSGNDLHSVRVNTLNNDGNNNSFIACLASTWGETGTGRQSAGCQGAIPNG